MTTTIGENELLPCPFCGAVPKLHHPGNIGADSGVMLSMAMVQCGTPRCYGNLADWKNTDSAIAAWNRRSSGLGTVSVKPEWQTMDTAPLDGKHCILAVPEPGGFVYSVHGAYQSGQWNCVHRDNVQPLYWMPNVRLPEGWATRVKSCLTSIGVEAGK